LVRHFYTDGGFAGDRSQNAHGLGAHAEGDVFVEAGDFFDTHASGRDDFVARDDRADVDFAERNFDTELAQDAEKVLGVAAVFVFGIAGGGLNLVFEECERRELVFLVVGLGERWLCRLLDGLGFDDVELDAACGV